MTVTILLACYNAKPHALFESVWCLLNQDDGGKHPILIINDGSTDLHTLSMLGYIQQMSKRIRVIDQNHGGTSSALNRGHALVQTDYVALMGDDVCHSSRLRLQLEYLNKHPETDVVGTNLFSFYDDDLMRKPLFITKHKEVPKGLAGDSRWLVNHGTVVYRQQAVMDTGGYQQDGRAQDVELWSRMIDKGYIFRNLTQILYGWRRYQ